MTSLTRVDARARAATVTDLSYYVRLDLTLGDRFFASVTEIRFRRAHAQGTSTFVDVAPDHLRSAALNGRDLALDRVFDPDTHRLVLDDLQDENLLVVDAVMAYSHDGEGLHRHVDPADGLTYLYAMSFLDAAPRWFACFDQPDLKARVSLEVTCPPEWTVAGNGPATPVGDGRWQVAPTGPLAPYFTTLVAGPYHSVHAEHDGIPLVLHARRSLAEHLDREAPEIFATTRHSFDRLHELFGVRYPWGEYHQAFVPEFNAGAMENPGCVTLRDSMVYRSRATDAERDQRATTIAHEMAHMWFGDLVTMRWWDDLWLNESFAEYLGHRVIGEHIWPAFGIGRKSWGFRADRRPSTHPVAGNGAEDAASALSGFDGISYAKGASVLRQLAAYLGDDLFLTGLRRYVERHADGNAEFADLLAAWADSGATGLDEWAQAWLRTSGMDVLSVDGPDVVRTSPGAESRPHAIAVAALDGTGAVRATGRVTLTAERTPHRLDVAAGDVVVPDCDDETWATIRLPNADWTRLAAPGGGLAEIVEPRTRVALWNALQLAVADAVLDPVVAVDLAATALPQEPDDAVLRGVSTWVTHTVVDAYLTGSARDVARARLHDAFGGLAHTCEPGSSRQLTAARAGIAATTAPAELQGWVDGAGLPDGLVLDAELRWTVLRRLAALGALSDADIDAELAADPSSQGAVHAAACRAARPDDGAKVAAWHALMADAERPNYELYAIAEAFWVPGQEELLAPYVERYFGGIAATAAIRSGWVLDRIALLAYPWAAVAAGTLEATERLLADSALPAGVRRSVVDAGDDLRRALASRTTFAR